MTLLSATGLLPKQSEQLQVTSPSIYPCNATVFCPLVDHAKTSNHHPGLPLSQPPAFHIQVATLHNHQCDSHTPCRYLILQLQLCLNIFPPISNFSHDLPAHDGRSQNHHRPLLRTVPPYFLHLSKTCSKLQFVSLSPGR